MAGLTTQIRFDALRSAIYHGARRYWLETINRLANFVVIIAGASAVSDLFKCWMDARWFAFIATIAGTIQLVYDFGGRAKEHQFLQVKFYALLARIEENITPSDHDVSQWNSEITKIYGEEPPTMKALNAISFNNAAETLNMNFRIKVRWLQSFFRNIYPFNGTDFFPVARNELIALKEQTRPRNGEQAPHSEV